MVVVGSFKLSMMKLLFLSLLFFSLLLAIHRLFNQIGPVYKEMQILPKDMTSTEGSWDKLLNDMKDNDLELVGKVKTLLRRPASGKYNLKRGDSPFKEHVLEKTVRRMMTGRGYFVEVGSADGETRSPTISLEMEDMWEGLLIEADLRIWEDLIDKKRKVNLGLGCVGLTNRSYVGKFGITEGFKSRLIERFEEQYFSDMIETMCYPLYTFLLAAERTRIDFMVLNINGKEIEVLKSLPWNKTRISILAVCYGTRKERDELQKYLAGVGFTLYKRFHEDNESFVIFRYGKDLTHSL